MEKLINFENICKEDLLEIISQQANELSKKNEELSRKSEEIAKKNEELEQKNEEIAQHTAQIKILQEYLALARQRQFANKSEKFNVNQLNFFDEADIKNTESVLQAEDEIRVASFTRKKAPGRKALPADLPRKPIVYDLTEEEKKCDCGCELTHICNEKSEQLEIIPMQIYVIEHIRKKYACKQCYDTIKTAPYPTQPIPRSIAAPGLLSHVLISKFQDHLPLYRQEQILRRVGVDIPRATLSLWVIRCAELLKPLVKLLHKTIVSYDVAYSDETTLQVLKEPNKTVQSKKYMWLFSGGPPDKFAFYYQYHPDRKHSIPADFFANFKGYLHCDGFTGYDTLALKNKHIILSGCMYHARRKFAEVAKLSKNTDSVSKIALSYIAKLAKIEEDIKELDEVKKFEERQEKSKPILDEFRQYLIIQQPLVPPKSTLGLAISYTLNQWTKLLVYLKDGRLENNNNRSERAIKPFVIGRKGWLFSNSVQGAHAASIIYSLVETCKWHNIEPYDWFRYVLKTIPLCGENELENLLPFNINRALLAR